MFSGPVVYLVAIAIECSGFFGITLTWCVDCVNVNVVVHVMKIYIFTHVATHTPHSTYISAPVIPNNTHPTGSTAKPDWNVLKKQVQQQK